MAIKLQQQEESGLLLAKNFDQYFCVLAAFRKNNFVLMNRLLDSGTLTLAEKRIMQARVLLRSRKWSAVIEVLNSVSTPEGSFLAGERASVLSAAYTYLGETETAIEWNLAAVDAFNKVGFKKGSFTALYNLSVQTSNLGLSKLSDSFLQRAAKYAELPDEMSDVLRGLACSRSQMSNFKEAVEFIEQARLQRTELTQNNRNQLDVVSADIFTRAGQHGRALEILARLRRIRSNRERGRTEFDYFVLRSLIFNEPLPPVSREHDLTMEYNLKWEVLWSLQAGLQDQARAAWAIIIKMFPKAFSCDFKFVSESDAQSGFGKFLNRVYKPGRPQHCAKNLNLSGRAKHLLEVLSMSTSPLRKEELIEILWGVQYDPSFDSRFYKLVERVKAKAKVNIISVHRAYSIKDQGNGKFPTLD